MKEPWQPPARLDPECLALCVALNKLPGITTFSSCCGHGREPYRIWFDVARLAALQPVVLLAADCTRRWQVIASDCLLAPICFVLEGPPGDYVGAESLARSIERWMAPRGKRFRITRNENAPRRRQLSGAESTDDSDRNADARPAEVKE